LNLHRAGGVRQIEVHTAEPFVPQPIASQFEVAVGKLRKHKSPGFDQIPAEIVPAGGELIKFIVNKEFPYRWQESVVVPISQEGHKTD
jgi:hypothetical protein